jgi:RNA polymerase sigma-70 factor, ECF subfamily
MQARKDTGSFGRDPPRVADRLARRIRAAAAGDQRAVRLLLGEVGPAVDRVVTFVLGPEHPDTVDLIQDSLMELLRALPPPGQQAHLTHLAGAIALRRALEAAHWPDLAVSPRAAAVPRKWLGRFLGPAPQELVRQQRRRLVAGAVLMLPEDEAEVLGLRLLVGLTVAQISKMTGLRPAQVRRLLRSGKSLLGAPAAPFAAAAPLHPEALRDRQLSGTLGSQDLERLAVHEAGCAACGLERDIAADFARAGVLAAGASLGRAIDAATAQWVWAVTRRVLHSRRQRRWTWTVLGALVAVSTVLAAALWSRAQPPNPDLVLPGADLVEPGIWTAIRGASHAHSPANLATRRGGSNGTGPRAVPRYFAAGEFWTRPLG